MILASDYDVTLTQKKGKILQSDIDAIANFRANGHKFGICSGRSISNIEMKMNEANISVDFMVGNNGAIAVNGEGKVLVCQTFSQLLCQQLAQYIAKTCLCYAVCDGYHYSFSKFGKGLMGRYLNPSEKTLAQMIDSGNVVSFIIYIIRPKYVKTFQQDIQTLFPVSAYRNTFSLDIMPHDIDKAKGCAVIEAYFKEKLYCIGDGDNDLPMLKSFEGFAVERGSDMAKSSANHVVDNVGDAINYLTENNCVL